MALSNYLTRGEWNAVFFAGVKHARGKPLGDLGAVLTAGIASVANSGYTFQGLRVDPDGQYHRVRQVVMEDNASVLVEFISGEFDDLGRAREAVAFADKNLPNMDWQWLKDMIRDIDVAESAKGNGDDWGDLHEPDTTG